jgi:hypothetical protein
MLQAAVFDIPSLPRDGAQRFAHALSGPPLAELERALAPAPAGRAGVRLSGLANLRASLTAAGEVGRLAASLLGPQAMPVRAILFDKSEAANWSLGWHQDRTIVVKRRIEVEGYGPWSRKGGLQHVAPPFEVLQDMITLRVHLDPVDQHNAPLLVALGSHRLGRILESDLASVVARCGVLACLADAGDVWAYATPIVHASNAASRPSRRRVLQVDYAAASLDGGLEWREI